MKPKNTLHHISKNLGRIVLFVSMTALIGACAPKSQFVLLPDTDGKVGKVTVSNQQGSQTLDTAYQSTEVSGTETEPSEPVVLPETEVDEMFGDALEAQPKAPVTFLLYFNSGTSDLTDESQALLTEIIKAIEERTSTDISIIGHTDRAGSKEFNYELALKRARTMADILISKGVDAAIINTTSHGEENPLIETVGDEPEPKNRRVEITIR